MTGIPEDSKIAQAVIILTHIPGVPNSNVGYRHTLSSARYGLSS